MKIKNIIATTVIGAALISCSFLDVEPKVICSDTFYNTEEEVLYGLAGVYGVMSNEAFYGNYYSLMCSNVDDLCYFNRSSTTNYTAVYRHDASATEIYAAWTEIYKGIRNANAFLEAVPKSGFDQEGTYCNEARFLRAYYYFILAQAWGDVPLRKEAVTSHDQVMCAVTPQYDVLAWAASEMEGCLALAPVELSNAPSRVTRTTIQGILARVYLFMAGESVKGGDKKELYRKAMEHTGAVIEGGLHRLNPDYTKVFINMIMDEYDTEHRESMWEVDFLGNRSSAENWSNGRIGDLIGLQSSGSEGYNDFKCNFAYGQYDGSLKLWDLYYTVDKVDEEAGKINDLRHEWNMPPYNYAGCKNTTLGIDIPASLEKAPYIYKGKSTFDDPSTAQAIRNCGKWRREVEYEKVNDSKRLYTGINFPILRYSDILLMHAEASLEYNGSVDHEAYDCVKAVRDRAGVSTKALSDYDAASFRELVRNERGREFCFEATRKYDLIRWGIFVDAMQGYVTDTEDDRWSGSSKAATAASTGAAVQPKHVVLPIPSVELGVNNLLVQNPLW